MDTIEGLLLTLAKLLPSSPVDRIHGAGAEYRRVRSEYIKEHTPIVNGKPSPSQAAKAWRKRVWSSDPWKSFLKARAAHGMGDVIEWEFETFKLALITEMAVITTESEPKVISHATGMYRRYRTEFSDACAAYGKPGQAQRHLKALYQTDAWKAYQRARDRLTRSLPHVQERRRAYAKEHYETMGKSRRASPEVREKLNAQRRARYAKAKQGASSP